MIVINLEGDMMSGASNQVKSIEAVLKAKSTSVRKEMNGRNKLPNFSIWRSFSDCSQRSMIHGVSYLGEKNLHWAERAWWLISFSISICLCVALIYQIYFRWLTTPAIISFSNEATPVSKIPFPTITMCYFKLRDGGINYSVIESRFSDPHAMNISLSEKEFQQFYALSNICAAPSNFEEYVKLKNLSIDRNIRPYLNELMVDLFEGNKFPKCILGNKIGNCKWMFSETVTDVGPCRTFNHLGTDQIYHEDKLAEDFPKTKQFKATVLMSDGAIGLTAVNISHPYLMASAGIGFEMSANVLKTSNDLLSGHCLGNEGDGLRVHIHSADEVPRIRKHFHYIPFDHDVHLTIYPNIIKTDASLIENYSKEQRKCIADNEQNGLVFFKKYSQSNCHLEKFVIRTVQRCGCALYWMPRFNQTKVCSFWKEQTCVLGLQGDRGETDLENECLPSCNSITYDADISLRKIGSEMKHSSYGLPINRIHVVVSFKNEQYFSLRRSELYTRNDFIAGCGGILGLFIGFSFLSAVEILYSATLRIFCDVRRRHSNNEQRSISEGNQNK